MAKLRKTIVEEKEIRLIATIKGQCSLLGLEHTTDKEKIAVRIGVKNIMNYYARLRDPKIFKYRELVLLFQVLQFSEEQIKAVM